MQGRLVSDSPFAPSFPASRSLAPRRASTTSCSCTCPRRTPGPAWRGWALGAGSDPWIGGLFAEAGLREAVGGRGAGRAPKPTLGCDLRGRALGVVWPWGRASSGWGRDARFVGPVGQHHAVGSLGSAPPTKVGGGTHPSRLLGRGRFKARGPPSTSRGGVSLDTPPAPAEPPSLTTPPGRAGASVCGGRVANCFLNPARGLRRALRSGSGSTSGAGSG